MNVDMSGQYVARATAPRRTPENSALVQKWEFAFTWTDDEEPPLPEDGVINRMHWHKCSSNQNQNFSLMWKNIASNHKDFETPDGRIQEYKASYCGDSGGLVQADGSLCPVPVLFQTRGYTTCKYILQQAMLLGFLKEFFGLFGPGPLNIFECL